MVSWTAFIWVDQPSASAADSTAQLFGEPGALAQRALLEHASEAVLKDVTSRYYDNKQLAEHMHSFAKRCSTIARTFSLGKSVEGQDMWVLEISDHPGEVEAKPNVKYVANMHGDEPSGRQLLLGLAEWLCIHHATDERAKRIVTEMHLYLLPTINPDGFTHKRRENSGKRDLNRDYPDPIHPPETGLAVSGAEQPETQAVMKWTLGTHFVAGASMHEGAIVANYPWDGSTDQATQYSKSPDDATFKHLASVYADAHRSMHASKQFAGGITNGAAWYPVFGGMQDWNYLAGGCLELTLELSEDKWPAEERLPQLWQDNLPALLAFPIAAALGGLRGFVHEAPPGTEAGRKLLKAAPQGKPLPATISVQGIDFNVSASATFGDYYRPLAPGQYTVTASMDGYAPATQVVTVPADNIGKAVKHADDLLPAPRLREPAAPSSPVDTTWADLMQRAMLLVIGIPLMGLGVLQLVRLVRYVGHRGNTARRVPAR
ncbi:hypothetical protein WJX72_010093 [[Myrmecia] bisecta]|uniref:Peptidase M14 domain-containing protein n=1 Tax=[Myrmecia] bisecta TaxID=41462 RepID=A0AAW1Q2Y9_9CHLO